MSSWLPYVNTAGHPALEKHPEKQKCKAEPDGKGGENFPDHRVPEEWHRGGGGDRHTQAAAGPHSAWLQQGSPGYYR